MLPPGTDVVFLALHGTYGEDGTVQDAIGKFARALHRLRPRGQPAGLRQSIDKEALHRRRHSDGALHGVQTRRIAPWPDGWQPPVVLKPVRQGSSVGLQMVEEIGEWPSRAGRVLSP